MHDPAPTSVHLLDACNDLTEKKVETGRDTKAVPLDGAQEVPECVNEESSTERRS